MRNSLIPQTAIFNLLNSSTSVNAEMLPSPKRFLKRGERIQVKESQNVRLFAKREKKYQESFGTNAPGFSFQILFFFAVSDMKTLTWLTRWEVSLILWIYLIYPFAKEPIESIF